MKKFTIGEIMKTTLKVKNNLLYNDNVTVKFIEVNEKYTDVLISISEIDFKVIRIDFKGLFDIPSVYDWITFEINRRINNMLQDYIYKR